MVTALTCKGCQLSKGVLKPRPKGGVVSLQGGWLLNHYGGSEGFLGWLAIQPAKHRVAFEKLSLTEASSFGPNIKLIDRYLRKAWRQRFPNDPIERMYLVYFLESSGYHFHAHLIPRTRRMASILKKLSADGTVDAWRTPCLSSHPAFPDRYKQANREYSELVTWFMAVLRKSLASRGKQVRHKVRN